MAKKQKRRSDRAGRRMLRSLGRPPAVHRAERRRFWVAVASGQSSEDAARTAGVSPPVGGRWFRESGGVPPSHLAASAPPRSVRYLSYAEREELAILRAQGCGVRESARRMGCAPSTISRELRRNAATRSGGLAYRATTAQWHADRAARRPKAARLGAHDATAHANIAAGRWRGVLSRFPTACGVMFRTIRPCASVTRPSTKRCTSKAAGPCAGS